VPTPTTQRGKVAFVAELKAEAPQFWGQPVDIRPTGRHGPPAVAGRFHTPVDPCPRLDPARQTGGGGGSLTRTPTCMHPFSAKVTFGAELYEEYMCQFMFGEVKFKDFRKANIPKFELSQNDTFVHWFTLFCSTCLQWDCGAHHSRSPRIRILFSVWWTWLSVSVRQKDALMSGLINTALNQESTFASGSRE
jgi:hypothetical protein